jgi:hypothetical protein
MLKAKELTDPASCMSRARPDEMVFVLLSRDEAAPEVIRFWVDERIARKKNVFEDPQIQEALACASYMEEQRSRLLAG